MNDFPWPPDTVRLPPKPRQSFELTVEGHTRTVKTIGNQFKHPDDDWDPVLILDDADDSRWLVPLGGLMHEDTKWLVAHHFIPLAILETETWCASFVTSAWGVFEHAKDEETQKKWESAKRYADVLGEGVTPATSPKRKEVLMLNVVSKDQTAARIARIYRSKNAPPKLGKWEDFGKGEISGQFFEPMRKALRLVT